GWPCGQSRDKGRAALLVLACFFCLDVRFWHAVTHLFMQTGAHPACIPPPQRLARHHSAHEPCADAQVECARNRKAPTKIIVASCPGVLSAFAERSSLAAPY